MTTEKERRVGLSEFIDSDMEAILEAFEEFARTHTEVGATMSVEALRDHAAGMLTAIARDLERPQTATEQAAKAMGDAPRAESSPPTAAERHGRDRAVGGFTLAEMFAEYRALRASVLRLWIAARGGLVGSDLQDLIRFNEAIDQALAESIQRYSASIDEARETFIAILGHDLRTPLSAVLTATALLAESPALEGPDRTMLSRIRLSSERMSGLVRDLLDFTLSRLGRGLPVRPTEVDIEAIAHDTVDEVSASQHRREIRLEASGDLRGRWDGGRLRQALGNVVDNAVRHGNQGAPITIALRGDDDRLVIAVHNQGAAIPPADLRHIFAPFRQLGGDATSSGERAGVGLGLYIAEQIVVAHGGRIEVRSSADEGTTFILTLPRTS